MKGNTRIIELLNEILTNELTAINQFFLHARMLQNWGINELGDYEYHSSIDEMKHADEITKRILFLEGLPNLQKLHKIRIGEDVKEILEADQELEKVQIAALREAIVEAEKVKDFVSRDLFFRILASEEEHIDWLETQLELIERVGMQNYVQSKMGNSAPHGN